MNNTLEYAIIFFTYLLLISSIIVWANPTNLDFWDCTKSKVVKDTLPREEVCIQYTRKENK